ncbi:hypothetical protein Vadar_017075 [Vaccinium darrowii]|uniref:Uncharacterized protein n=1 Tax=Vaccinium darrowii TaxID=229202 RepID=A0ACB7ZJH7_9ERIC|nr:hypothetical protein Vadar_017075 [Vaccinium darrowii]
MFPYWSFTNNTAIAPSGRICVVWDPAVLSLSVLSQSTQGIHCLVQTLSGDIKFMATFVYGSNLYLQRQKLWQDLTNWNCSDPWIVLGDFNATRFQTEKIGGDQLWPSHLEDFNKCIVSNELEDLRYIPVVNLLGLTNKPTLITLLPKLTEFLLMSNGSRPTLVPMLIFPPLKIWRRVIIGNPMFVVCEKLKLLQLEMKKLNTREFSDITKRTMAARQQLDQIQRELGIDPTNSSKQALERDLCKQYLSLSRAEESFAKQKSRIQWLKLGDQCTSYFFKSISQNRNRNKINSLALPNGTITNDPIEVRSTFVDFYTSLLGTVHSSDYPGSSRVNQLVTAKLLDSQRDAMISEISNQEIKETFMSLNPNKAPGPDGYNAGFFQKSWSVVGNEVTSAVRSFFRSGRLLTKANSTSIALVPKVPNPTKVGDYRPISCCNTIYKCIAKILAKRIQVVLPHIIDPVQSGFVKGRRITDNIFLTQEIMRDYHKSSPSPKCALKVDIMKAYDNVRWEFLWDILISMNFHPQMINWIKACISTANYSLSINGEAIGSIMGKKGLRQGDPLSSYLFVIVMEVLTQILKEKSQGPNFHFHWRCEKTRIINLCFADDLMIFCKGELSSILCIQEALTEFEALSGLSPSPGKSNIFFSGVPPTVKQAILEALHFQEGTLPVRYLGVPLISTKLKYTDCKALIDRITNRTKSWANKYLSYAGRIQLVTSVLFSMQTKEGGLGFKSLQIWNKAAMAKHIWFLVSGGEKSMWCQWVKSYLLKGKSFWKIKIPSSPSWTWRKLLQLRPLIQPFIKYQIGDGSTVSLWYDNWHPSGPLAEHLSGCLIYNSGLADDAKVSSILNATYQWSFPITQNRELNEIRAHLPSLNIQIPPLADSCKWTLTQDGLFSISSLWEQLRPKFPVRGEENNHNHILRSSGKREWEHMTVEYSILGSNVQRILLLLLITVLNTAVVVTSVQFCPYILLLQFCCFNFFNYAMVMSRATVTVGMIGIAIVPFTRIVITFVHYCFC